MKLTGTSALAILIATAIAAPIPGDSTPHRPAQPGPIHHDPGKGGDGHGHLSTALAARALLDPRQPVAIKPNPTILDPTHPEPGRNGGGSGDNGGGGHGHSSAALAARAPADANNAQHNPNNGNGNSNSPGTSPDPGHHGGGGGHLPRALAARALAISR